MRTCLLYTSDFHHLLLPDRQLVDFLPHTDLELETVKQAARLLFHALCIQKDARAV